MGKVQILMICWSFGVVALWFFYQALLTQSVWVKRNTFQSPWYYKVSRNEKPFAYWANTVALGLTVLAAFVMPIFMKSQ